MWFDIITNMKSLNLRKYTRRQKDLKKALSWWEDQDENPDINYVDFSKRKILFDFGSFRRVVDPGARLELICFVFLVSEISLIQFKSWW